MCIQTDQKRGTLNGTQTAITSGTFEQQWGLDATANNGSMNERRYAMQDGNWNAIAICDDTTGTVTGRYAYSAYGTPFFMTGADAVVVGGI